MTTFSKTIKKPLGTILCIDDDDDDAALLETAVENQHPGIKFLKCFGGNDALQLLHSSSSTPDLILLDVNMPVMNGFDCLKKIQEDKRLRNIPVFMISTSASPKDVALAIETGARKFLTKPNTYQKICDMVNEIIDDAIVLR